MQHLLKLSLFFASVFFLVSCGDNKTTEKDEKDAHKEGETHSENAVSAAKLEFKNEKLEAVYQHYIHLTTALTNGDQAEAKVAAGAIEAGANEMGASSIAAEAAKITAAGDIEAERSAYSVMSNDLIALVKKEGLSNGELYVAFCPMAFNDKGAFWLTPKQEIRNPYFGVKMLKCGEIKDTVK